MAMPVIDPFRERAVKKMGILPEKAWLYSFGLKDINISLYDIDIARPIQESCLA